MIGFLKRLTRFVESVRIAQHKVNSVIRKRIMYCLHLLNFNYVEEEYGIRIIGGMKMRLKLLHECLPRCRRKADKLIIGHTTKGCSKNVITGMGIGQETKVYNLETGCNNYIANGFIVHNCYVPHSRVKHLYEGEPHLVESAFKPLGKDKTIFVGSMFDIWADSIPAEWIVRILEHCRKYDNTYLLQSKNPKRFLDFIKFCPDETFLFGTTIETNRITDVVNNRVYPLQLLTVHGYKTMVSLEPIMGFDIEPLVKEIETVKPSFVSIGADSKGHNLPEPSPEKVEALITELKKFTEVKIKDNLKRLRK